MNIYTIYNILLFTIIMSDTKIVDTELFNINTLIEEYYKKNQFIQQKRECYDTDYDFLENHKNTIEYNKNLFKTIKYKIDQLYYNHKLNFIEIEYALRNLNSFGYLIAQPKHPEIEGTKTVNSDNQEVELTTYLIITSNIDDIKDHIFGTTQNFKEKLELNLQLLINAGITIITNPSIVKKNLINIYNSYMDNSINDY